MPAKKLSETDKVQAVLDLMQAKRTVAEIRNRYGICPKRRKTWRSGPGRLTGEGNPPFPVFFSLVVIVIFRS